MIARLLPFAGALIGLFGLAGCQAPPGPGQDFAALQALPASRACVGSLPPFGRWIYALDDGVFVALPHGTIVMGDDGGWCQIRFQHYWGQKPLQAPLAVLTPPAHGEAMVGSVGLSLRIAYKPAPGFTGTDHFTVHLTAPEPWDIPVAVTVVH
ncbi:MAG: hypothetical protein P4L71_17180 [Acetobacteraceae bacterium]|nr:hypothetical protein [Acetobacteraceae bacterium]